MSAGSNRWSCDYHCHIVGKVKGNRAWQIMLGVGTFLSEVAAMETYETKFWVVPLCELLRLYPLSHILAYATSLTDKT